MKNTIIEIVKDGYIIIQICLSFFGAVIRFLYNDKFTIKEFLLHTTGSIFIVLIVALIIYQWNIHEYTKLVAAIMAGYVSKDIMNMLPKMLREYFMNMIKSFAKKILGNGNSSGNDTQ